MSAFIKGIVFFSALIVSICAQNTFVLKQGLARNHIAVVCLISFFCDVVLLTFGVCGLGETISRSRLLTLSAAIFGILFLVGYGACSFTRAFSTQEAFELGVSTKSSLGSVVGMTLSMSLLNPHIYLDTVVLVGGMASTLAPADRPAFLLGTILVSCIWFLSLGLCSRFLLPLFKNPRAWQILEFTTGILLWYVAVEMVFFALKIQ